MGDGFKAKFMQSNLQCDACKNVFSSSDFARHERYRSVAVDSTNSPFIHNCD